MKTPLRRGLILLASSAHLPLHQYPSLSAQGPLIWISDKIPRSLEEEEKDILNTEGFSEAGRGLPEHPQFYFLPLPGWITSGKPRAYLSSLPSSA